MEAPTALGVIPLLIMEAHLPQRHSALLQHRKMEAHLLQQRVFLYYQDYILYITCPDRRSLDRNPNRAPALALCPRPQVFPRPQQRRRPGYCQLG